MEAMLDLLREDLLQRDMALEEVSALLDKAKAELTSIQAAEAAAAAAAAAGSPDIPATAGGMAKQVNELQSKIKEVTRKTMAVVSELSMYQANAIRLTGELNEAEKALQGAETAAVRGLPPAPAAEARVRLLEKRLNADPLPSSTRTSFLPHLEPAKSTAELRPNAYIPEGIGIPRPYEFPPFKPSELTGPSRIFKAGAGGGAGSTVEGGASTASGKA